MKHLDPLSTVHVLKNSSNFWKTLKNAFEVQKLVLTRGRIRRQIEGRQRRQWLQIEGRRRRQLIYSVGPLEGPREGCRTLPRTLLRTLPTTLSRTVQGPTEYTNWRLWRPSIWSHWRLRRTSIWCHWRLRRPSIWSHWRLQHLSMWGHWRRIRPLVSTNFWTSKAFIRMFQRLVEFFDTCTLLRGSKCFIYQKFLLSGWVPLSAPLPL